MDRAVVVGSSGGAVTALALTQARPDLVSAVVSHEPPIHGLVPDHTEPGAQTDAVVDRYLSGDVLGVRALFISDDESGGRPACCSVAGATGPSTVGPDRHAP